MSGKLHSLTDVLKKTLFFFDAMTVEEITPYVHRHMLRDYNLNQVAENTRLCLQQHPCFYEDQQARWLLNLEGKRENDKFYTTLLSKLKPVNLKEIHKSDSKKKKRRMLAEQAALISDGRFIQLSNGYWGLTEWEVENSSYSLKQLVIKGLKMHPTGLSPQQLFEIVRSWRNISLNDVQHLLKKFPYFERIGDGVWCYNPQLHLAYENILERFLSAMDRRRKRWHQDRQRWQDRVAVLQKQVQETNSAYQEAAAALALRAQESGYQDQLLTQLAEKDLLLSLRKKEVYRYREHLEKTDAKANSILHQCRLWVARSKDAQKELQRLRENMSKNQSSLETMFTKLQQYKEKDRRNKVKALEIKDMYTTKVAELQTEIVELKQKLARVEETSGYGERKLHEEINLLGNDLKGALEGNEDLRKSLQMAHQELNRARDEYKRLEVKLKNPLVRMLIRLCFLFNRKAV